MHACMQVGDRHATVNDSNVDIHIFPCQAISKDDLAPVAECSDFLTGRANTSSPTEKEAISTVTSAHALSLQHLKMVCHAMYSPLAYTCCEKCGQWFK